MKRHSQLISIPDWTPHELQKMGPGLREFIANSLEKRDHVLERIFIGKPLEDFRNVSDFQSLSCCFRRQDSHGRDSSILYHKLNLIPEPDKTPLIILRIVPNPSSNDLVILRRKDFEDFLGRLPTKAIPEINSCRPQSYRSPGHIRNSRNY